jgi:hypothetical protein
MRLIATLMLRLGHGARSSVRPHRSTPRNRPQSIPNRRMRERNVCGLIPSATAAPKGPSIRPRHRRSAASIASRPSLGAREGAAGLVEPGTTPSAGAIRSV